MTAVGGFVVSFSFLGRPLSVPEDVEVNIQLGGDNNDVLMNGDGTGRLTKTLVPWTLDGLAVSNDHEKKDHEFLQNAANKKLFGAMTIGLVSGVIYQGDGQITDTITASSKTAIIPFNMKGPGQLTQQ